MSQQRVDILRDCDLNRLQFFLKGLLENGSTVAVCEKISSPLLNNASGDYLLIWKPKQGNTVMTEETVECLREVLDMLKRMFILTGLLGGKDEEQIRSYCNRSIAMIESILPKE